MASAGSRASLVALLMVTLIAATPLRASDMRVSATRVAADETLTVTVSLDGAFADVDGVSLPLSNLAAEGGPSVESQYQWINGRSSSRKTFRYTVRPLAPGAAFVGPLVLVAPDGAKQMLPRIDVEVVAEIGATADSPVAQLRELAAAGRERVVLAAEPSSTTPLVGQQVVVTWYLYTQESVRDVRLSRNSSTTDFWSEEIPVSEGEETNVMLDGTPMKKVAVRRVALFPLRTGVISVTPMELRITVLTPAEDVFGGISMFNYRERDVMRRSRPVTLAVREVPGGGEQVGSYTLSCTPPVASPAGPVSFEVTLSGDGYVRAAKPPQFTAPLRARSEFTELQSETRRSGDRLFFTRRWRVLLFPEASGTLQVPALGFRFFDLQQQKLATLTCGGGTVQANVVSPAERPAAASTAITRRLSPLRIALAATAVLAMITFFFLVLRTRRERSRRSRAAAALIGEDAPTRELRRRIYDQLRERTGRTHDELLMEATERGDRFRAVASLLDLRGSTERERSPELERELQERVASLIEELEKKR